MLARIIQTAGDPAPHDPELRPDPFLFVCIHAGSENFCRLFGTPLVQGITETGAQRSEEHTSELQSPCNLVCRLLLEKKKKIKEKIILFTIKKSIIKAHIIYDINTCAKV